MEKGIILVVIATLFGLFLLFTFVDCNSCCKNKTEAFCTCSSDSERQQNTTMQKHIHKKPNYYGYGTCDNPPWNFHYGEPYYVTYTNEQGLCSSLLGNTINGNKNAPWFFIIWNQFSNFSAPFVPHEFTNVRHSLFNPFLFQIWG